MQEIKFDPYDYNNNVWVDGKLHIITDNFELVNLIKEKMGDDMGKFVETIFNTQVLNSNEINDCINNAADEAVDEFKDMELLPIFNKLNAILDSYNYPENPNISVHDLNLRETLGSIDTITTEIYKLL
jgi:hypothetical protein